MTGSTAFGGITSYANTPKYSARNSLIEVTYGNAAKMTMTVNNRLLPSTFKVQKTGSSAFMDKSYEYYGDGQLKKLDDNVDNGIFDRLHKY